MPEAARTRREFAVRRESNLHESNRLVRSSRRRGAVLVWFVFLVPMMMLLLIGVTDYGTTAMARIELKNATDSAALAAVKSWTQQGAQAAYRDGEMALLANPVVHQPLRVAAKEGGRVAMVTHPEDGLSVTESQNGLFLGVLQDFQGQHVFVELPVGSPPQLAVAMGAPACVTVRKTVQVAGLTGSLLSVAFGPYLITAESTARICPETQRPQLAFVDAVADSDASASVGRP